LNYREDILKSIMNIMSVIWHSGVTCTGDKNGSGVKILAPSTLVPVAYYSYDRYYGSLCSKTLEAPFWQVAIS
jgi:hypothetical protein